MTDQIKSTLIATVAGTAAGLISWFSGLTRAIYPIHPQLCALLITVFTGIVFTQLWPYFTRAKKL